MTSARYATDAARAAHSAGMKKHREKRNRLETCHRCNDPVAFTRSGKPMRLCEVHAKADRERKAKARETP